MEALFELSLYWIIALSLIAFAAGFIDAVAGGGGMLNLPALLFAGVPPVSALAVNKMTGIAGTTLAVIKFALNKKIHWRTVSYAAIPCLVASYIGGRLALNASATVLAWAGKVIWTIAIPMLLASSAGGWMGSHSAIKGGDKFIRKVLVFVLVLMLAANIYKMGIS